MKYTPRSILSSCISSYTAGCFNRANISQETSLVVMIMFYNWDSTAQKSEISKSGFPLICHV